MSSNDPDFKITLKRKLLLGMFEVSTVLSYFKEGLQRREENCLAWE